MHHSQNSYTLTSSWIHVLNIYSIYNSTNQKEFGFLGNKEFIYVWGSQVSKHIFDNFMPEYDNNFIFFLPFGEISTKNLLWTL